MKMLSVRDRRDRPPEEGVVAELQGFRGGQGLLHLPQRHPAGNRAGPDPHHLHLLHGLHLCLHGRGAAGVLHHTCLPLPLCHPVLPALHLKKRKKKKKFTLLIKPVFSFRQLIVSYLLFLVLEELPGLTSIVN
uniref:Macaca fascicularis brain cDNA clone: QmoA-12409, similar to human chemokine-like factor super family 5 (CKLFSF5),transcript variant 1, mRNA, RefSeq: NM_138460.2 n=1 Tax=Macaca fascicularis TaxID=9541 RepID=I7G2X5_MACFA|nr:unnamed protein product [Macaca fascicularis]